MPATLGVEPASRLIVAFVPVPMLTVSVAAGAPEGLQFAAVLQLLSPPPPVQTLGGGVLVITRLTFFGVVVTTLITPVRPAGMLTSTPAFATVATNVKSVNVPGARPPVLLT